MKYFSEDTVKEIIAQAHVDEIKRNDEDWGERKPIDLDDYPSIDLPDKYGRLIDADALLSELEEHSYPYERGWYYAEAGQFIDEAETVLEASK